MGYSAEEDQTMTVAQRFAWLRLRLGLRLITNLNGMEADGTNGHMS